MTQLNDILGKYGFYVHHGVTSYSDALDFIAKIWEVISDEEKDDITDILVGQNHPVLHGETSDMTELEGDGVDAEQKDK